MRSLEKMMDGASAALICMLLAAITLAGCSTYRPPEDAAGPTATLTGSQDDKVELSVVSVDEKGFFDQNKWDDTVTLAPGQRKIKFAIGRPDVKPFAYGEVQFVAEADHAYVLRGSPARVISPGCTRAEAWVEDDAGEDVSGKVSRSIVFFTPGTTIFIPGGGFVMTPGQNSPTTCPDD